jgi:hypothetical protein
MAFGSSIIRAATKPIIEGYSKGLINETFFKEIGEANRHNIQKELRSLKSYFTALYKIFISKQQP